MARPAVANTDSTVQAFYQNRQITLVISTSAGGGYDAFGRLIARFMGRHIPGQPSIVAKNMPGAAHLLAANWLYSQAPQDGSTIAIVGQTIPDEQLFGNKAVAYDAKKLNWIGSVSPGNNIVTLWHTAKVRTVDDLRKTELIIGAAGPNSTSSLYPTLMNNVLGTKFKIVSGYTGGNEVNMAMERGEVLGRGSNAWASWKSTRPEWLREGKLLPLVQIGVKREPDLQDVPLLTDLARTDEERRILSLYSASVMVGRPIVAPPGIPAERVAALREAFRATVNDPEFVEAARKLDVDVVPVLGAELQDIVAAFLSTPSDVVSKAREAMTIK